MTGRGHELAAFSIVWFGQTISTLGSAVTAFGFAVWLLERDRSISEFGAYSCCGIVPLILISPIAGPLIDRWNRRSVLLASNAVAAVSSFVLWALLVTGRLHLWHMFVTTAIHSVMSGIQRPAYSAATALLVPREHYGRAAGMIGLSEGIAQVAAPMLAAALLGMMTLPSLVLFDLFSFLSAMGALALVRIPHPVHVAASGEPFRRRIISGWRYLRSHRGLLFLQAFLAASNFTENLVVVLMAPLVLSFADETALGRVMSIGGSGLLMGALAMSAWGGPRRRIRGALVLMSLRALILVVAVLRQETLLLAGATFVSLALMEIVLGSLQAIWLEKIPLALQGRVFALRQMVAMSTVPVAYLLAGPLAEGVFEPLMARNGALAGTVGRLLGTGPGRGIALLFIVLGAVNVVLVSIAALTPSLMNVETEIPNASPERPRLGATQALQG